MLIYIYKNNSLDVALPTLGGVWFTYNLLQRQVNFTYGGPAR